MLVLSRKKGEVVMIGDLKVIVKRIGRNRVELCVEQPPGVKVLRGELVKSAVPSPSR